MDFTLDNDIDLYAQYEDDLKNRETALHLKEIIPRTIHLDESVFKEIIGELKTAMDEGHNFKDAFTEVSKKYFLVGDVIKAVLPGKLTRLILNAQRFMDNITAEEGYHADQSTLVEAVKKNKRAGMEELFPNASLAHKIVVFATFAEYNMEANPFENCSLQDSIDRLAMDSTAFWGKRFLTAVCIRYHNRHDIIKRFPVFTDAGWHDKFYPCQEDDRYGKTKPLKAGLKSMPEIVHKNLKLADVIVEIQFLKEENMSISNQNNIDKILSFTFKELKSWINSRLKGDDKHFPIYEGDEPNLHYFLYEAYHHIEDEDFRGKFRIILDDLIDELNYYSQGKERIEENKEYLYEAISLFRNIPDFTHKSFLYDFADDGNFKGIEVYGVDLHLLILNALASHQVVGDYEFWIEQIQDDSNKLYTHTAFHALIKRKYRLDIIFRVIGIFIDRFIDDRKLDLGINELIKNYGYNEIINQFKAIESKLSPQQKEAVNEAFTRGGSPLVFKLPPLAEPGETGLKHPFIWPGAQVIAQAKALQQSTAPLPEKAVKIFKWLKFKVKRNLEIAGHTIEAFIEIKNISDKFYEYWVCFFDAGKQKTGKDKVLEFYHITEAVKKELKKESPGEKYDDVRGLVVSEMGFTGEALALQEEYTIDLLTLEQLFSSFFLKYRF
jgi:hypothetical protein